MLGLELTPRSARRHRRKVARDAFVASAHEELFLLLTTLRAASSEALHALHFADHPHGGASLRSTYRWLAVFEEANLLERQILAGHRSVYRMTHRALTSSPRVARRATETFRRPMSQAIASYTWLRSSVWAEMKNRGYRVGRGRDELRALRRFLVDTQREKLRSLAGADKHAAERVLQLLRGQPAITPLFRSYCSACGARGALGQALESCVKCKAKVTQVASELRFECPECGHASDGEDGPHEDARDRRRRCSAQLRETDHLPFDVAWREAPGGTEVVLIVVDDPTRALEDQLNVLPLRISGQPRLPVMLRTTDEESIFDSINGAWIATGSRHRDLLRAFGDGGLRSLFPFVTTTTPFDVRPELQLRLRPPPNRIRRSPAR